MKITIDIEPAATGVRTTGQASGSEETVVQATREFATKSAALSAGVSMAAGSGEKTALFPAQNVYTGTAERVGVAVPNPNPTDFTPTPGVGLISGGLSAGGARGENKT